jgi:hypothetical protein
MEQGFPWEDPRICKRVRPWVRGSRHEGYQSYCEAEESHRSCFERGELW